MSFTDKEKLRSIIQEKGLITGNSNTFELASGDKSNFFFDMKVVSMDPEGSELMANAILETIQQQDYEYIGGLESGSIPIASVVANKSFGTKRPIPAFFVRKTSKGRGTNKVIEGNLTGNSRVIVVEDVTTKGESVLVAVKALRELGCEVDRVITIVDRLSGASELLAGEGVELVSIFTKDDFSDCI